MRASYQSNWAALALASLIITAIAAVPAIAEGASARKAANPKRIALLIGNGRYTPAVGPLANPTNDVNLLAAALNAVGFSHENIQVVTDADRVTLLSAVDTYVQKIAAAGPEAIGFFYYSGHGAANQRDKRNYLIPVGVEKLDRSVWYQAIALDDVVSKLSQQAPDAAHFVIFDACRNLLQMPTKGGKGFVPIAAKRGMLIAFSTDPGETASDEGERGGPYATALARELIKPNLHHLDLFQNVKERVHRVTGVQVPWERNGLLRRVYLNESRDGSAPNATARAREAEAAWSLIRSGNDPAVLRAFATRYGDTFYGDLALARLNKLQSARSEPSAGRSDDFRLTTPKWQNVSDFRRLSRKEAISRLSDYTIVYANGVRDYFAPTGDIVERAGVNVEARNSKWVVGQTGRVYLRYLGTDSRVGSCSGYLEFNPARGRFRIQWRNGVCSSLEISRFERGKQLSLR